MDIYLPIAEMSVNLLVVLAMGAVVGFLSGMFGVGGGFLMTPLLIFLGVPPTVAVGTQASQILASSFSSVLTHLQRKTVDLAMGAVLAAGGFVGSGLGVLLFQWLRRLGYIDLVISLSYVILLGIVGVLTLNESARAVLRTTAKGRPGQRRLHPHWWIHRLPLKFRFQRSRLYISIFVPLAVGALVGVLTAVMGIGGGFIMIPLMIYLIGMPAAVVVGTSLFQICFVAALTGFLHAYANHTVDIILGLLLILGAVVGAQLGTRAALALRSEYLRLLLAVLILAVCGKLLLDLVVAPEDVYQIVA